MPEVLDKLKCYMIIFLLILLLIISFAINVLTIIIIRNLLIRTGIYEKWILECKQDVINTLNAMQAIDKQGVFSTSMNDKGMFESDDQVGQIFKELIVLIEKLDQRTQ
jgi:hypothetical protein